MPTGTHEGMQVVNTKVKANKVLAKISVLFEYIDQVSVDELSHFP